MHRACGRLDEGRLLVGEVANLEELVGFAGMTL